MKNFDDSKQRYCLKIIFSLFKYQSSERDNELIDTADQMLQMATLDLSNQENKIILLTVLYKCSLLSYLARPFESLLKWHKIEAEELWKLGDLEMKYNLQLSNRHNNRELYNREQMLNEQIKNVQPLFNILKLMAKELEKPYVHLQSNLTNLATLASGSNKAKQTTKPSKQENEN